MENHLCHVCGAEATGFFGSLPLCDNITCHTFTSDMINNLLAEAAEEATDKSDPVY